LRRQVADSPNRKTARPLPTLGGVEPVIDELMGHHTGRRWEHDGSAVGARYRHMTPEMQARVLAVIEQHLSGV
jgi:hypothetical protein